MAVSRQYPVKGWTYTHFTGGRYTVLGVAMDEADRGPVVVYREADGAGLVWVRTLESWLEDVTTADGRFPRFVRYGP